MTTKIVLISKDDAVSTTCGEVLQHIWNEYTIHNPSKRAQKFFSSHNDDVVFAKTAWGEYKVTEIITS